MTPDWNEITAVSAAIASSTAIVAVVVQGRRDRFAQSVDVLLRFEERFDDPVMRKQRSAAATSLISREFENVEPILDFFETIGLLVDRGSLDIEMVQSSFLSWIHFYCYASREHIARTQQGSPDVWCNLMKMYKAMLKRKAKKQRVAVERLHPTQQAMKEFYEYESRNPAAEVPPPKVSISRDEERAVAP